MENNFTFNSMFIREFHPGKNESVNNSEIVYHYTSPEAFLSIIQGKSVRFSDIRYMNDKSETIFFVKRLLEFAEKEKTNYPYFCEAVDALLKENDYEKVKKMMANEIKYCGFPGLSMEKTRNFIFCTSNDSDSLLMWNYYASNGNYKGYNIGLDVGQFLKTFDVDEAKCADSFLVYYGNVIYQEKKQFEAIEELADALEIWLSITHDAPSIHRAAIIIRSYIKNKGPFFKDSSFKAENEFRFLISIAERNIPHCEEEAKKYIGIYNKCLQEVFYIKNGLVVPCLQVAIPDNSIHRVTISPMTEYEISKSSIKELLTCKKIEAPDGKQVRIYKSGIPIRF